MKRKLTVLLCAVMAACLAFGSLTGCSKKKISNEKTAFTIASEEMDGVFNPFFYTSGPDGEVVGMTQLGMLTTNDDGELVAGDGQATVVDAYNDNAFVADAGPVENGQKIGETTFTFVLKNGLTFSDGVPLSIRDVLFNLYVYLDPVYTGSSTIYSTAIKGLSEYRTQSTNSNADSALETSANTAAVSRRANLMNAVRKIYNDAETEQKKPGVAPFAIDDAYVLGKLKETDAANSTLAADKRTNFEADYKKVQELYRDELNEDFRNAQDAYKKEPYNFKDVEGFMYDEGLITWDKKNNTVKTKDFPLVLNDNYENAKTDAEKEAARNAAIEHVYTTNMPKNFSALVQYYGTAVKLMEQYVAEAKQAILQNASGTLAYPNITGIKVLDGKDSPTVSFVDHTTGENVTYEVAKLPHGHKDDGTYEDWGDFNSDWSVSSNKRQVLQITINGVDPKAIWNFSFSVAPLHYYSSDALTKAFDIDTNHFGVEYASMKFMDETINHISKVGVPVGAGPYKATDYNNSAKPTSGGFFDKNTVYFTRNDSFLLGKPVIKLIRYQVINQAQSITSVKAATVHYSQPQATTANMAEIAKTKNVSVSENKQNGYGYIGINAGKISNVHLRRAIMYACDTSLTLEYYGEHAEELRFPMSTASWAYPDNKVPTYDYTCKKDSDNTYKTAQQNVLNEMSRAGIKTRPTGTKAESGLDQYEIYDTKAEGKDVELKYTFTIAGSNLTEHPTYTTFRTAQEILNACGWDISVDPDNYALSKLASGSLTVWAAAWSATIDPDMYQVYHRSSTATSTYSWGYREMKNGASSGKVKLPTYTLTDDYKIVGELSDIIVRARKSNDQDYRIPLYEEALNKVMELAVELPTYQRSNLYLYNKDIVDGKTLHANDKKSPYTNPLSEIWTVSLKQN